MRGTSFGKVNGPIQRLTRAVKIPGTYYSVYLLLDNNFSYLSLNFRQLEEQRNIVKSLTLSGILISLKDLLSRTVVVVPEYTAKEISRLIYDDYVKVSPEIQAKLRVVEVVKDDDKEKENVSKKILEIDQKIITMDSVLKKLENSVGSIQEQLRNIERDTHSIESQRIIEPIEKKTKNITEYEDTSTLEDHLQVIGSKISNTEVILDKSQILAEVEKARLFESEGNLQNALQILQNVIISAPENIKALLGLGRLSKKMKKNNLAIEYYESALEIEPKNVIAISDLAVLYKNIERITEADYLVEQLMQISAESLESDEVTEAVITETEDKGESLGLKTLFEKEMLSDDKEEGSVEEGEVYEETQLKDYDNRIDHHESVTEIEQELIEDEKVVIAREESETKKIDDYIEETRSREKSEITDSKNEEIPDITESIRNSSVDITVRTIDEKNYSVRHLRESTIILEEPESMEVSVSVEDLSSDPSDIEISVSTEEINMDDYKETLSEDKKSVVLQEEETTSLSEEEDLRVIGKLIDKKIEEIDDVSSISDRDPVETSEDQGTSSSEEINLLLMNARNFLDSNDFISAAKEYTKIIEEDPDNFEAIESIADYLYENDKVIESIPYYKKLGKKVPDNIIYPLRLAKIHHENGDLEEAVKEYKKVLNIDSENVEALETVGGDNLEKNKLEEASKCFVKLTQLLPENSKYQHCLANIYKKQDNYDSSVYWLERALEFDSDNPSIWSDLSIVYRLLGRQEDASIATKQAMELVLQSTRKTLENTRRLSTKALLNVRSSDLVKKEADITEQEEKTLNGGLLSDEQLPDINATTEDSLEYLNHQEKEIHSLIEEGNLEKAKQIINNRLNETPNDISMLKLSGKVYLGLKEYSSALNSFNKAVQQLPNDKMLLYYTGKSLRLSNKPYQALEILKKSIFMGNESPDVYYEVGLCNHSLRYFEKAIENFKYALLFDPDSASYWASLGATYQRLGRLDAGYRAYSESLRIDPDNDDIKSILKILKELKET